MQQCRHIGVQGLAAYTHIVADCAPWVVFSNSLATDKSIWDAQVEAVSQRWNILRYDQRGHGASALPEGAVDFALLGADVIALMDHFSIERAAYVGLSMGVPTGLSAVSQAPARITGLLLADGQAKTAPGGGQQWRDRIASVQQLGLEDFARSTAERWLADPQSPRRNTLEAMIAATPVAGFTACSLALADFDLTDVLGGITCPVLLVAGERDGKLPETMQLMAASIPGADFASIANAGHVPCFECPEAFNAALLPFLESLT
ncbi:alpha/beta fold hydrolase [Rhizobium sp. FY34]|uniref:alpha/beta fold hydrolase n=1 Tax=Rhizobium sp. FY34 TaxID=2562309 RepID=UPI001484FFDD|nr:alpha/beta fold hydrolase [Rhizobium sp. FY34]